MTRTKSVTNHSLWNHKNIDISPNSLCQNINCISNWIYVSVYDDNSVYISYDKQLQFSHKILLFWYPSCRNRKWQTFLWWFIPEFGRFIKYWDNYAVIYICIFIERMFRCWNNFAFAFCLVPKHYLSFQNLRIVCKRFNANVPIAFSLLFRWLVF